MELENYSWSDMKRKLVDFVSKAYEVNPDVDDLGDYLPFMAYFGELAFCRDQISKVKPHLVEPIDPTRRTDTVLGLVEYYRLTKDKEALCLAEKYIYYLFDNFLVGGWIYSPFLRGLLRLKRPMNGMYIELLTDMYDLSSDEYFLDNARVLAASWIKDPFFMRHSLFRANQYADCVNLFKDNTSVINGLISLYEATEDEELRKAIYRWFRSVSRRCFDDNGIKGQLDFTKNSLVSSVYGLAYYFYNAMYRSIGRRIESQAEDSYSLRFSFPLVDIACYGFHVFKDDFFLDFAENICDFWIKKQSNIGLFPITSTRGVKETILDPITDFAISLWGLHELSGNDRYRQSSVRSIVGLFRYHYPHMKVNYQTGEVLDPAISNKYVSLLLKIPILLKEGSVFGKREIFKLLRDR